MIQSVFYLMTSLPQRLHIM